jgi:hypothetical protein
MEVLLVSTHLIVQVFPSRVRNESCDLESPRTGYTSKSWTHGQ